ncbi:MAG: transglutaminase family protein [Caldilineaceae bacterium]
MNRTRPSCPKVPGPRWALADVLDFWDYLHPTPLTRTSELLCALAQELALDRSAPPLTTLLQLNTRLHRTLAYDVEATEVDSPIEDALQHRRGVCQDYAHIMLALLRNHLHIPCRYVSGYLYHSTDDRSADGASHAWLEAWLPGYGWLGLDPTNNLPAGASHSRGRRKRLPRRPAGPRCLPWRGRGRPAGARACPAQCARRGRGGGTERRSGPADVNRCHDQRRTLDPAADPAVAQQQQQQQQ